MIERELYMQQIRPFINRPFVKVITGIRRSGKSVVLRLIYNELKNQGVEERRIVYMNFESFEWIDLLDAKALYAHMKAVVEKTEGRIYILLDEVQEVKGWERAVNSFLVDWDVDVYVTGSNSKLLSSELATYLAGRYVSFHVMPLSFREYLLFHAIAPGEQKEVLRGEFQKYLRMGGFPVVHTADYDYEAQLNFINVDMYKDMITLFFPTRQEFLHISSGLVKDALRFRKNVDKYIPEEIREDLNKYLQEAKGNV